jgi:hypothetical protein
VGEKEKGMKTVRRREIKRDGREREIKKKS